MIAYAAGWSRTPSRRNLAAVRAAGWRLVLSPAVGLDPYGLHYGLDNGAWSAFVRGEEWDHEKFIEALVRLGPCADWVVLPDLVEGGDRSLVRSLIWLPIVLNYAPLALIPTQDNMTPDYVRRRLSTRVGIFVGGSTEFKEATMPAWAAMAREIGAWCHVGRVNTVRRIRLCHAAGVTSFDGSSVSRYSVNLRMLENARRQPDLFTPK